MQRLTYDALVAELFPRLTGGIRWGLDRTRRMLAAVGDPHRAYRVLHVGGTNGKGSVAAHLESVLRQDGRSVALYSSPHLCSFRERIRLDGRAIDEDALLRAAERLWPLILREEPSFFEATTAIAFLAMAEAGVDTAVVEVGLGGRLDATNVVSPDVVVLTNVSLDHVQLLGATVPDVAREKAGIIKAGVPVVTGETGTDAADEFRDAARAVGAPIDVVAPAAVSVLRMGLDATEFAVRDTAWGDLVLTTPLLGAHQAMNAALAVRALGALPGAAPALDAVRQGIAATRWHGRLQVEVIGGVTWVFDVAHNVAGVEALVTAVETLPLPRPVVTVVGVLGDKDWAHMLSPLYGVAGAVILTVPPTAPSERRWDPVEVLAAVPCGRAEVITDFSAALARAQSHAAAAGSVLVTGSFHTVGDALAAFGRCPDGSDTSVTPPAFVHAG
ncbi:MAG TPA: folylpolyglutamate synthase/dihydrofolate synthase family protein [Longimicrobiales bacterium]|nr:folylpolyglutamate synthase/dihydrofolate synthase family protein [Longimicrobiales bacterium]